MKIVLEIVMIIWVVVLIGCAFILAIALGYLKTKVKRKAKK